MPCRRFGGGGHMSLLPPPPPLGPALDTTNPQSHLIIFSHSVIWYKVQNATQPLPVPPPCRDRVSDDIEFTFVCDLNALCLLESIASSDPNQRFC